MARAEEQRKILAQSALFGGLAPQHLDEIQKIVVTRKYGRGR